MGHTDHPPVPVTVAVCTYNRASILPRCLVAVAREVATVEGSEVVVVDNGSTDDTASVIADLGRGRPWLRYERLAEPGLSCARNRALEVARTGVVAFLDDDAEPDRGWLMALGRAFGDQSVVAVAGPARLVWETGPPRWLGRRQASKYSEFDLGPQGRFLEVSEHPYGVNMAVRRDPARDIGGFEPLLGRRGRNLLSNEEDDLFRRFEAIGARSWYQPGAAVVHHVPADRARLRWLLRRSAAQGWSDALGRQVADPRAGRAAWLDARGYRGRTGGLWREIRAEGPSRELAVDAVMLAAEALGAASVAARGRGSGPAGGGRTTPAGEVRTP